MVLIVLAFFSALYFMWALLVFPSQAGATKKEFVATKEEERKKINGSKYLVLDNTQWFTFFGEF